MADAAVQTPNDVVPFLVRQHEQIKSLFAETLAASGKARQRALVELRRLLAVHETAEEEIVHPRAKRKIPNGDKIIGTRLDEEHEEQQEFVKLEQELGDEELERMGRAAKLAEALAPTRPHAGVESQTANLFAGPLAAMMDRDRDTIIGRG